MRCFLDQENAESGKSLAPNQFGAILLQSIMWQLKRSSMCNFSHMTFLMSHVTCLNNGLEKIVSNQFKAKLFPKRVQWNLIILGENNYELDFNLKYAYNNWYNSNKPKIIRWWIPVDTLGPKAESP